MSTYIYIYVLCVSTNDIDKINERILICAVDLCFIMCQLTENQFDEFMGIL